MPQVLPFVASLDVYGAPNPRLEREKGAQLAIQIGIYIGLVVGGSEPLADTRSSPWARRRTWQRASRAWAERKADTAITPARPDQ
jgi:hypothetical protein